MGYSIEIRLSKTSADSDRSTMGDVSGATSFEGWGRENMSLNTSDDATNTDQWTWKLTRSDDWRMMSGLGMSEYFGRKGAFLDNLA